MFESLYTYDKNYAPIPMLAESHTVTDGGAPEAFRHWGGGMPPVRCRGTGASRDKLC